MNRVLWTLILVFLLGLFFTNSIAAQGGCGNITYTLEHYEQCHYRFHVDNSSECYSQLRLLLDTGEFVEWQANTASGWTAEPVRPTEIMLAHSSGIIRLVRVPSQIFLAAQCQSYIDHFLGLLLSVGRGLREQPIETGAAKQTIQAGNLPAACISCKWWPKVG